MMADLPTTGCPLLERGVLLSGGAGLPIALGQHVGASDDDVRAEVPQVRVDGQPGDHDRVDVGGEPANRARVDASFPQVLGRCLQQGRRCPRTRPRCCRRV